MQIETRNFELIEASTNYPAVVWNGIRRKEVVLYNIPIIE
jgi:hypothetical protein